MENNHDAEVAMLAGDLLQFINESVWVRRKQNLPPRVDVFEATEEGLEGSLLGSTLFIEAVNGIPTETSFLLLHTADLDSVTAPDEQLAVSPITKSG